MKSINTLVEDIYNLAKAEGVKPATTHFGVSYTKWWDDPWQRKPNTLSFSEVGKPCLRQLWYDVNVPHTKEPIDAGLRIKFLYGDMLEDLVLSLAESAGHTVEKQQEKVKYDVGNGWFISGRIDAVIDGVVVDVKSTTKYGVKKFENNLVDDPFGYKHQLTGYAAGLGIDSAGFITIQKELGHIAYFPQEVDKGHFHAQAVAATEAVMEEENTLPRLPDVPMSSSSKNKKLCTTCSYCGYKKECWPHVRTFLYSNGPVFLTEVVDEPRVKEVV